MQTLNFESGAWVSREYLHHVVGDRKGLNPHIISMFNFDASKSGYVRIGTARMELQLEDDNELRMQTAATLRAEIDKVRADSMNKITELTRKLNEVLAIEFDGAEVLS